MRNSYKTFVGKSEGNETLGKPWCRWEDTIKIDLTENGFGRCGLDSCGSG
jgi:hypothetical protein